MDEISHLKLADITLSEQLEIITNGKNYDDQQEIARSGFADMLHDTERNVKYNQALEIAINKFHSMGIKANVLDIGTGTGLLSMMAVKCGADSIIACEAFLPMANCAEEIININEMSNKIKLIKKRSTSIIVGPNCDMEQRANILVTEVFDTELIGEGAIDIFKHAHEVLLEKDCIVIPHSAKIYAQGVECSLLYSWNKIKLLANLDGEILLRTPDIVKKCEGSSAVHDIQLSQLPKNSFKTLIEPLVVLEFDWSGKTELLKKNQSVKMIKSKNTGSIDGIFMWWELQMDVDGKIMLSCAPYWAHPDFETLLINNKNKKIPEQNLIPWRDHWMQAIYYIPQSLNVNKNDDLYLITNHDEYSLWFNVEKQISNIDLSKLLTPYCNCFIHTTIPRTRIGQINNNLRNKKYIKYFDEIINKSSSIVWISDNSLIGLSITKLDPLNIYYYIENDSLIENNLIKLYKSENKLNEIKIINNLNSLTDLTDVIGEPYFINSILPWDNFYFGLLINKIKLSNKILRVTPCLAKINIIIVEFLDLYKINSNLNICESFNLNNFDKLLNKATLLADDKIEAQPLWEYPCFPLSNICNILTVDFNNFNENINNNGNIILNAPGLCNGVALWVDWYLDGSNDSTKIITSGPISNIEYNKIINWDMYTRQGIYLFKNSKNVNENNLIKWNIQFKSENNDMKFDFEIC